MIIFIPGIPSPPDLTNLGLIALNGIASLTWDSATDLDVKTNGQVIFRHSQEISGAVWENAVALPDVTSGGTTSIALPLVIGTYLVKFVNSIGGESVNATSVVITEIADIINTHSIIALPQHPNFTGTKTNMVVVSNILKLDAGQTQGTYEFDTYADVGTVQTCRITLTKSIATNAISDLISSRTELISTWTSIVKVNVVIFADIYISTTNDDPSGSPTWSDWRKFNIADYTARAFKFKLEVLANNTNEQLSISELSVSIAAPDRVETQRNITSGTTTKSITYVTPFNTLPTVGITATNMSTGDYFIISNEAETGFDINFYDLSDVGISRIFNYHVNGF